MKKHFLQDVYLIALVASVCGFALGFGASQFLNPKPVGSEDPMATATRLREGVVESTDTATKTFRHEKLGFSISYPNELEVSEFDEGQGARTILFQRAGEKFGFQIFAVPYQGDTITEERIAKDIPSKTVREPVEAIIGGNTRATVFWSMSPAVGDTREVWFIKNGYLFEVTTYADQDAWLAQILSTLTFTK